MTERALTRRALLMAGTALALGGLSRPARSQLRVDITRGQIEPLPIAISPFAGDGAGAAELGRSIAELVSADLDGSGLFRTIDRRAYIQSPDELRNLPRFADWRQINAQGLVTGVVRTTGADGLAVEFRLWDVFAGTQMAGFRYDLSRGLWRRVAHKIADAVYERMTGERGYFDTRIVYVSQTGPATRRIKRIALMDQDGANHRFLTRGRELVLTPRFTPDARSVAYLAYRGRTPGIYLRELASGRDRRIGSFSGMNFSPRFSPDGRRMLMTIARDGNSDIFAFDLASRRLMRLTDHPAIDTSPSFSPDGRRIVFNSDRGGSPQLYVMDSSGRNPQRISFGAGRYGSPAWSPRGDFIAFTKIKGGYFHIGVMRPDGSDERLITRSFYDEAPAWSPNGRIIMFTRQDPATDRTRLMRIDLTGYNLQEIPTPTDASDGDWSALIP